VCVTEDSRSESGSAIVAIAEGGTGRVRFLGNRDPPTYTTADSVMRSPPEQSNSVDSHAAPHPEALAIWGTVTPRILAYIGRAVPDPVRRRELFIETRAEIFAGMDLDGPAEAMWPNMLEILRRFMRTYKRDARHEARAAHGVVVDGLLANDDARADEEYRLAVREWFEEAVSHLTCLQRAALELHELDGRSDEDIAREFGCSQASLRVLRHHAKDSVRERVARGITRPPPQRDA